MTIPLIAVIGLVEPALLREFVAHYTALGVTRFAVAFHFTAPTLSQREEELLDVFRRLVGDPEIISRGPWHEQVNTTLREELRRRCGPGWHMIADSDEFHAYPSAPVEMVAAAERDGCVAVGGLMLDRVHADGLLTGWDPATGLDAGYPLGGFLTHELLRGDPRKVVLARHDADIDSGNHRLRAGTTFRSPLVAVHHFKWRSDVAADLAARVANFGSGEWTESTPAVRNEALRLLNHLDQHHGRLHLDGQIRFRPVTVRAAPSWWPLEAQNLVRAWKPPTAD